MAILFDEHGLKMWKDDYSSIIFLKFSAMPDAGMDTTLLKKKYKGSFAKGKSGQEDFYSVIDISECHKKCPESLVAFCFTHFPELLGDGIKYLAFVKSSSPDAALEFHIEKYLARKTSARSGCFTDFFGALNKINNLRQQEIASI